MKQTAYALILAFAMAGTAAAEQAKAKDKGKPKEQPSAQAPASPNAGKGKKEQPVASPAPSTAAGGAQCSPDKTAPAIAAVSATPNTLGAPNHKMTPVSITAQVTDNCGAATWSVTSIASNEPVNGTGDGDTAPDWTIAGAHGVSLRAERAGTGSGRTYTITITAKDAAGNASTGTTTVSVAHNR